MKSKELNIQIGGRVKEVRKAFGVSRDELAQVLDLSVSHIGLIERGERGLTVQKCLYLCDALSIPMEYIITGEGEAPTKKNIETLRKKKNQLTDHEWELLGDLIKTYSLIAPAKRNADLIFEGLRFMVTHYAKAQANI